jgi:thiamine kinase-like enzyme
MSSISLPLLSGKVNVGTSPVFEENFGSNVKLVRFESGNTYVYRQVKVFTEESFNREVSIVKEVAELGLGPKLMSVNFSRGEMLLEHIEHEKWGSYSSNEMFYRSTMIALRTVHNALSKNIGEQSEFSPFRSILDLGRGLKGKVSWLPDQFDEALAKVDAIYQKLTPWLQNNAVMCNGDFHKGNVLLSEGKVFLIDWTTAAAGHPFFDVAKFSLGLSYEDRLSLLGTYLGHEPTIEEKEHFKLIDLTLLVLVTVVRFNNAAGMEGVFYTKEELGNLVKGELLPSFLKSLFSAPSPRIAQFGAICALQEFTNTIVDLDLTV